MDCYDWDSLDGADLMGHSWLQCGMYANVGINIEQISEENNLLWSEYFNGHASLQKMNYNRTKHSLTTW